MNLNNLVLSLILGGAAGWIASMVMKNDANQGMIMDIILGIVGGLVGGFVMNFFGQAGVTGFNLYSLVVSVIGACVLIAVGRIIH
jgi:uncharacterized membrane protein YeaQ/YmgE (transglycosylase-associated protein family)